MKEANVSSILMEGLSQNWEKGEEKEREGSGLCASQPSYHFVD